MKPPASSEGKAASVVSNVTEWFLYDDFESLAMTFRRTDVFFTIPLPDDTAWEASGFF